jgi:prepilin signal peptidase PulO-like enzyme (type II secretory pathway)
MGLGDVHLLAAVGAAAGPAAAVAAFFAAPFLGLAWVGAAVLLNRGRGGGGTLQQGGMPFGPHLALGAVTAVALSPAVAPLLRTAAESLSILARAPGA